MWEAPFCGEASVSVGALAARAPHPSPSARVSRGNRVKPCCSCHGRDPRGARKDKRRRRHPGASFRPFALSCLGYGMTMDYSRGVPRHPWCFPPPFFWCPVILHACQIARLCICVYVYMCICICEVESPEERDLERGKPLLPKEEREDK
jgi:hypothetical protein